MKNYLCRLERYLGEANSEMMKVPLITVCGRRHPADGGDGRWMLMVEGAAGIGVGRDLVARGALRQRGIWSEGAMRGYRKRYI